MWRAKNAVHKSTPPWSETWESTTKNRTQQQIGAFSNSHRIPSRHKGHREQVAAEMQHKRIQWKPYSSFLQWTLQAVFESTGCWIKAKRHQAHKDLFCSSRIQVAIGVQLASDSIKLSKERAEYLRKSMKAQELQHGPPHEWFLSCFKWNLLIFPSC